MFVTVRSGVYECECAVRVFTCVCVCVCAFFPVSDTLRRAHRLRKRNRLPLREVANQRKSIEARRILLGVLCLPAVTHLRVYLCRMYAPLSSCESFCYGLTALRDTYTVVPLFSSSFSYPQPVTGLQGYKKCHKWCVFDFVHSIVLGSFLLGACTQGRRS